MLSSAISNAEYEAARLVQWSNLCDKQSDYIKRHRAIRNTDTVGIRNDINLTFQSIIPQPQTAPTTNYPGNTLLTIYTYIILLTHPWIIT